MRPPEAQPRPKRPGPNQAVRRAQAEAGAAERVVAAVSAKRLMDCLRLAPAERLRYLDDPDLVSADRVALRRSVEASLVPERRKIPLPRLGRPGRGRRRARSFLVRATLSPLTLGLIVVGGPWLALSWQNTRPLAVMAQRGVASFRLPDGSEQVVALSKGSTVTVFDQRTADPVIGVWYPRLGYATAAVPRAALQFQR